QLGISRIHTTPTPPHGQGKEGHQAKPAHEQSGKQALDQGHLVKEREDAEHDRKNGQATEDKCCPFGFELRLSVWLHPTPPCLLRPALPVRVVPTRAPRPSAASVFER